MVCSKIQYNAPLHLPERTRKYRSDSCSQTPGSAGSVEPALRAVMSTHFLGCTYSDSDKSHSFQFPWKKELVSQLGGLKDHAFFQNKFWRQQTLTS